MQATVLIAAFDEAERVQQVVSVGVRAGLPVVVVDDGSTDNTAQVAAEAGAQVVRLTPNQGKSMALWKGLEAVHTPLVLLLDADLRGLQPQHLEALLAPVRLGQLDMSIGVFKGGGLLTDIGNRGTPYLSGQRACRTDWLRGVPGFTATRWPEPAIAQHLQQSAARWAYIALEGASQVMKEQKRGFWRGLGYRLRMYWDLLRFRWLKRT